jgi:hypothetical protein
MAGAYHAGERWLLLLKRQIPIEPYHRKAAWWNLPTGVSVSIEEASLGQLTLGALRQWLRELITAERAAPAVDIRRQGRGDGALQLAVTLANTGHQVIRLHPSHVVASFDAAQRHVIPPIAWETPVTGGWVALEPGEQLSGTISVDVRLPDGMATLPVLLGHLWLSFPSARTWVGYLTTEVRLAAEP